MASPDIAVLLRPCSHAQITAPPHFANKTYGFALKCENVSISYAKTPIQVPVPQQPPQIIDLGIYRPSISLSGVVETIGGDITNTTTGLEGMSSISFTRTTGYGAHANAKIYYIPYKNALEDFARKVLHVQSKPMELEWGDASFPLYASSTHSTGGAVYIVSLQQFRAQVDATKEDRYTFSMQFVVGDRKDS